MTEGVAVMMPKNLITEILEHHASDISPVGKISDPMTQKGEQLSVTALYARCVLYYPHWGDFVRKLPSNESVRRMSIEHESQTEWLSSWQGQLRQYLAQHGHELPESMN